MLLKVGMAMMTVALAFAAIAAGVAVSLRDEPAPSSPTIAAEPASKSEVKPPDLSYALEDRSEEADRQPKPESAPSDPKPVREPVRDSAPESPAKSQTQTAPKAAEAKPQTKVEPEAKSAPEPNPEPEREFLPLAEDDWPAPTEEELQAVNEPRHYDLPPGAIMGLTIKAIGLYNVPVFNSDSQWAFNSGVVHEPETSLPWSNTPQRNVYLAAHRLGNFDTSSRLVFFNLNELEKGDTVTLEDRSGKVYKYRVSETLVVDPTDTWVMGQVRGKDMLTLQTCTPIPTFENRLIVRADEV